MFEIMSNTYYHYFQTLQLSIDNIDSFRIENNEWVSILLPLELSNTYAQDGSYRGRYQIKCNEEAGYSTGTSGSDYCFHESTHIF